MLTEDSEKYSKPNILLARFPLPYFYNSIAVKYFKGNIHALFMKPALTNTTWCHKVIKTFLSVLLKIYSPAGAVNIPGDCNSLSSFKSFSIYYWIWKRFS